MPEISIVIPVYNMEQYLETCIKSVQLQDYEDYEVIIVDDGSTDTSASIASRLAEQDSRIQLICKENEGVSIARNTGMDQATGKWIMFVDPDDTLQPNLISSLLSQIKDETDIVACCCNAFDEQTDETDYFFATDRTFVTFDEKKDLYKQLLSSRYGQPGAVFTAIGVPWGKLYRREFLNEHCLNFNPRLRRYQDNLFNMYAFYYARIICYINQPLYNYRLEHIQKYGKEYKPGYHNYIGALCEERYICMKRLGLLDDAELREFYCREMQNHLWSIMRYDIFSPENPMSFREEKSQASELYKKNCFEVLFEKMPKGFTLKNQIKWHLMKGKHYRMIYMILLLRNIGGGT